MIKLSENEIRRFITAKQELIFDIFDTVDSTNTYLKAKAAANAEEGTVAIAEMQTAGKGRMGRAFLSPDGSGIYMSILFRPKDAAFNGVLITACAAVAVSEAIEAVTGIKTDVKWVNDLYFNGKKVAGILAEGAIDPKNGLFEYAMLGIGVNLIDTFKGTALEQIASGLYPSMQSNSLFDMRHKLIAEILNKIFRYYTKGLTVCKEELLTKYREKLFIIGKQVDVLSYTDVKEATVISLCDDFTLKVRYSDGSENTLNSGEVRLKIK